MLRVVTRSVSTGVLNYCPTRTLGVGLGSRRFHIRLAKRVIPTRASQSRAVGTRCFSNTSDNEQTPSVHSPSSQEVSNSTPESGQNAGDCSKAKKKVSSETKPKNNEDSSVKRKKNKGSKSKNKKGNEHIVAALAKAIQEDDWPGIIRHSTLNPQYLDGWYPGESDWLAAHRMSEALGEVPEEEWENIQENGVISPKKLAKVIARRHMGEVNHLPEVEDEEEMEFYRNWAHAIGYDFEEVWAALSKHEEKPNKKKSKSDKSGKPDGSRPGSA
ncbi:hypothetical protein ACGC1H_006143 [Rhizoctonia solani]